MIQLIIVGFKILCVATAVYTVERFHAMGAGRADVILACAILAVTLPLFWLWPLSAFGIGVVLLGISGVVMFWGSHKPKKP